MNMRRIRIAQILTVVIMLATWQLVGADGRYHISTPLEIARAMSLWVTVPTRWSDLSRTLQAAGLGFGLGVSLGTLLAIIVLTSRFLSKVATPIIGALNALPRIALAPAFIMLFGIGIDAKAYFVAAAIFLIPFYNIVIGVQSIDPALLQNVRILGANRRHRLREVYIPAVAAALLTSLRLTAAWSLLATILSEYIAASAGVGYQIRIGQGLLRPDITLAAVLLVAFMSFSIDRSLATIQSRTMRWRDAG